ncbi:4a-hydroxytetrahydrobiopterin dehydratase [Rhodococcus sp. 27YEA15]|uniref:4a-hydroxytetrahydrobiopterin dehydratase n=1 Tax=Rhodococcus sp. 27YEA15 TaxID=3156259 RepID=UPI003C7B6BE2
MPSLLSESALRDALADLPHWRGDTASIVRTVESETFPEAMTLLGQVAVVAEEIDHHPDIDVRWRRVTYCLSTHSAGGVTRLDVDLAHRIDILVAGAR